MKRRFRNLLTSNRSLVIQKSQERQLPLTQAPRRLFWATVCKTIRRCYRTVVCSILFVCVCTSVCLSVCLWRWCKLWPNGCMDQDVIW